MEQQISDDTETSKSLDDTYSVVRSPPNRRPLVLPSAISPFSTSPSQLQEISTLEDATLTMGLKSPQGTMRGRSVKDYEEQLSGLKKDNFNLKLRIYFLEERMGTNFNNVDRESIIKENIELKVEAKTLRNELEEKQDLLCQAAKVLELEENEHKKMLNQKDNVIHDLNQQLETISNQIQSVSNLPSMKADNTEVEDSAAFYSEAFGLQERSDLVDELKMRITELENQLSEERELSSKLENEIQQLDGTNQRCSNLEEDVKQRDDKIRTLVQDLEEKGHHASSLNLRIRSLEEELNHRNNEIEYKIREVKKRDHCIQEQTFEIEDLRRMLGEEQILCEKEQRQVEILKSTIMARNNSIAELETRLEKSKTVIRKLETKLETVMNEVKRNNDELEILRRRAKNSNNDLDSLSVRKSPASLPLSPTTPKVKANKFSTPSPQSQKNSSRAPSRSTPTSPSQIPEGLHGLDSNAPQEGARLDTNKQALQDKLEKQQIELESQTVRLELMEEENRNALTLVKKFVTSQKNLENEKAELETILKQKENIITELTQKLSHIFNDSKNTTSNKSLSANKDGSNEATMSSPNEDKELVEKYKELVSEMKQQIEVYVALLQEKNNQLQQCQLDIATAFDTLKGKENTINGLEEELITMKRNRNEDIAESNASSECTAEKEDVGTEKHPEDLLRVVGEKDKTIERLQQELRKRTCDLQGLVNKELWEKNREIERMQNRYGALIEAKEYEMEKLKKEIAGKTLQLHLFMDKIVEVGYKNKQQMDLHGLHVDEKTFDIIINNVKGYIAATEDQNAELEEKLKSCTCGKQSHDNKNLQVELEKSEKIRHETTEICALLTSRLEELALFLDVLLKHKSVLGFLGSEQKTSLRQFVDQSLDLSKNLSASMSLNPDQSLLQLSNISNILNNSRNDFSLADFSLEDDEDNAVLKLEPVSATLIYNNYLTKQSPSASNHDEVINKLREQVQTLKKEIELRDVEMGNRVVVEDVHTSNTDGEAIALKPTVLSKSTAKLQLKSVAYDNSESESWSEPDRSVSQARIGLLDESLKGSMSSKSSKQRYTDKSSESTDGDSVVSASKTGGRRESRHILTHIQDKIALLENGLKEKDNELLKSQCAYYEIDNQLKNERIQIEILKQRVSTMDEKMKLALAEKKRAEETLKTLEDVVNGLKVCKEEMEICVSSRENQMIELRRENVEIRKTVEDAETLKEKYALELKEQLREVDDKWTNKIKSIERDAEVKVKEIQDATNELKKAYERDWMRKSEVDRKVREAELIVRELEHLRGVVKTAEQRMAAMDEEEKQLRSTLSENEKSFRDKVNVLRKELDNATLATSEAVLERTRIANEKMKLEQELRKFDLKETELIRQVNEFEVEFSAMTQNYKKQVTNLEQQKSQLELRVSELESMNADLLNRLIKLQTEGGVSGGGEHWVSGPISSLPSSPNRLTVAGLATDFNKPATPPKPCVYKRQCSDLSGYTSDEIPMEDCVGSAPETSAWYSGCNSAPAGGDIVEEGRHVVNSSPDLGIESDQGRFSSLEANVNNARPLLQTLELTQSMTNLLAITNRSVDVLRSTNEECNCSHKGLEEENVELKKRLLRTRRALEETVSQLALANQRKKLVERAVCKQIHKTSQVLRKAKANLDSGSETDAMRK